ncbi:MAG: 50S ribosomal protein L25/general stress protein Ctc [Rickettsiales bacterium]|jgi:large subunit ribosomal protein L25|nr:50S ribosomal protein L25/general stress protein Ctc [Rickettsiales bacterium]
MTDVIRLEGSLREELGSSTARRLRKNNRLPAVVYGGGSNNVFVDIDVLEFEKEYFRGGIETRVFDIMISGRNFRVLCHKVDLDPRSDRPRHVDFLSLDGRKEARALVPIRFKNVDRSIGLKRGGYFNIMIRKLPLICPIDRIPSFIEVNCEDMKLRQSVRLSNLTLPEGSRPVFKKDVMLARIIGRGKDDETSEGKVAVSPAAPGAAVAPTVATATSSQSTAGGGGHGAGKK